MYTRTLLFTLLLFTTFFSYSQIYNQKVTNNKTGEIMLIGECTRDAFLAKEFKEWFNEEYSSYKYSLKKSTLDSIKRDFQDLNLKIIMGTWCSDSRLQFPHFMAILDYLKAKPEQYQIITVNRNKNAVTLPIDDLNVLLVPTFIVYRGEKELGRIIESPVESLEEDLVKIIRGTYTQKK